MNANPSFYLIAYDLHKPGQEYGRLEEAINRLEGQRKILETTWIVKTKRTSREIYDLAGPALDPNDAIYIVRIDLDSGDGRLPKPAWEWINAQKGAI